MSTSMRGIVYAIITAILWGTLAIVLKVSLSDLTPADITWFRFVMAFAVLAVYYYYRKPAYLRILKRPPGLLIIATLCLALNYFGFIQGLQFTSPSVAQIFIQLGPVILAISGFAFFHEKISARQIVGLFIVIAGLAIYYREQTHLLSSGGANWSMGVIWILIAAVSWAVYSILLKVLVLKYPPMQMNLVIFGLPALVYLPFVHFSHFLGLGIDRLVHPYVPGIEYAHCLWAAFPCHSIYRSKQGECDPHSEPDPDLCAHGHHQPYRGYMDQS